MNRRLLLRLVLLSLVSTLVALAFVGSHGVGAARVAQGPDDKTNRASLMAFDPTGKPAGECPLRHTEVKAEVSGFLSRVNVTQEFVNPFEEKIEAVYTFPLPQAAAVDDMTMRVGDRTIKGKIMRREEAQAAYQEAKSQGHVASLLDQERPNIFTQSVANIMPGQSVVITISYVETLKYEGGAYEWSFPMVVGQRYIPAGATAKDDSAGAQEDDSAGVEQSKSKSVPDAAHAGEGEGDECGDERQQGESEEKSAVHNPSELGTRRPCTAMIFSAARSELIFLRKTPNPVARAGGLLSGPGKRVGTIPLLSTLMLCPCRTVV